MIPKSFNEFTVRQFQKWHRITNTETDPITREYSLLAMLMGITLDTAEAIPFKEIRPLLSQLNSLHSIPIRNKVKRVIIVGRKPYLSITNPKELKDLLSTSQYTAALTYAKTEVSAIENMHRLLALFYSPYKLLRSPKLAENQEAMAETMLGARIGDVYGAVFFYSILWERYQPILNQFSQQASQVLTDHLTQDLAPAHGLSSRQVMDGITRSLGS